jgi:hypothetical protein
VVAGCCRRCRQHRWLHLLLLLLLLRGVLAVL